MPLPLLPIALRIGAAAAAGYVAGHWLSGKKNIGRLDQRAEDALDALDEGLATHRPMDLTEDRQTNASYRLRRSISIGARSWDVDAGLIARLRIREKRD